MKFGYRPYNQFKYATSPITDNQSYVYHSHIINGSIQFVTG